jgi:TonB family protein
MCKALHNSVSYVLLIGTIVVPVSLHAQEPAPLQPVNPSAITSGPAGPPVHRRPQRSCDVDLPRAMRRDDGMALVLMRANIDADGAMHDLALFRSSGDPAIDKTVLACADGNQASILRIGNEPAKVNSMIGFFAWSVGSALLTPLANGGMTLCRGYPPEDIKAGNEGDVTFSYHVTAEGRTTNIRILKSSGYPGLDQASVDCVTAWHFFPFARNGEPIEIDREGAARWRLARE